MTELGPKSPLRAISELSVNLEPDGHVRIRWPEGSLQTNRRALTLLDIFSTATTLDDAIAGLRFASRTDLIEFTETFRHLARAGVLRDPAAQAGIAPKSSSGFGHPAIHIRMLDDIHRTESYLAAIAESVCPEDIVVDLGTGSGVLAMAAARSGARHVYAIEASPSMCEVARRNFEINGLADRITLLQGLSTQVTMPEPADLLVSEIIGSDPYAEGVLAYIRDAAERLCKPEARFIPCSMVVLCLPVTIPGEMWRQISATPEALAEWQDRYQLDFSGLASLVRDPERPLVQVPSHKAAAWKQLAEPTPVARIDFGHGQKESLRFETTVEVRESGLADGILAYFDLDLAPGVQVTTRPRADYRPNSWATTIWAVSPPIEVKAGDVLGLRYSLNREEARSRFELQPGSFS